MKVVSNCTLLAASLTATYRSYQDFHPADGGSLESFLDDNGILLTMCMAFRGLVPGLQCFRSRKNHRVEASWIQANKTGFQVAGPLVNPGPQVGLVLKPSATSIRCVYPFDAGTVSRDDDGCGPLQNDIRYGSKGYDHAGWARKAFIRAEAIAYKDATFGANATWESIPCIDFFPNTTFQTLATMNEDNEIKFVSLGENLIQEHEYILRHKVCNHSIPAPEPTFEAGQFTEQSPTSFDAPRKHRPRHACDKVIRTGKLGADLYIFKYIMYNRRTLQLARDTGTKSCTS